MTFHSFRDHGTLAFFLCKCGAQLYTFPKDKEKYERLPCHKCGDTYDDFTRQLIVYNLIFLIFVFSAIIIAAIVSHP